MGGRKGVGGGEVRSSLGRGSASVQFMQGGEGKGGEKAGTQTHEHQASKRVADFAQSAGVTSPTAVFWGESEELHQGVGR